MSFHRYIKFCVLPSLLPFFDLLYSVFFFPLGFFFSVSHHLQFFFGFPLENIIFFPPLLQIGGKWWENVFFGGKKWLCQGDTFKISHQFSHHFPVGKKNTDLFIYRGRFTTHQLRLRNAPQENRATRTQIGK